MTALPPKKIKWEEVPASNNRQLAITQIKNWEAEGSDKLWHYYYTQIPDMRRRLSRLVDDLEDLLEFVTRENNRTDR